MTTETTPLASADTTPATPPAAPETTTTTISVEAIFSKLTEVLSSLPPQLGINIQRHQSVTLIQLKDQTGKPITSGVLAPNFPPDMSEARREVVKLLRRMGATDDDVDIYLFKTAQIVPVPETQQDFARELTPEEVAACEETLSSPV